MATYFVDASNGSDSANGTTIASPWKTISKVNASSFLPGDQVVFKRGETWREQLNVPSSGSAGHPLMFSAYGSGALPLIDGSDDGVTPVRTYCVNVSGKQYVTITYLAVARSVNEGIRSNGDVAGLTVEDCTAVDCGWQGIRVGTTTTTGDCAVRRCVVTGSSNFAGIGPVAGTAGTTVCEDNIAHDNGSDAWADHGIYASNQGTGSQIIIRNNVSYGNAAAGIKCGSNVNDAIVHNNVTYDNGRAGYLADTGTTGVKWYHNVDDGSLVGYYVYDSNTVVDALQNCISINAQQYGVYVRVGGGTITTIDHNLVYNATTARYQGIAEGADSLNADPLFTDEPGRDYTLTASSPCIDAATSIAGIGQEATPDIGAENWPGLTTGVLTVSAISPTSLTASTITEGSLTVSEVSPGSLTATALDPSSLPLQPG